MKVEWNPGRSKKGFSQACHCICWKCSNFNPSVRTKNCPVQRMINMAAMSIKRDRWPQQKLPRQVSTKIFLLCKVRMARNLRDHRVHWKAEGNKWCNFKDKKNAGLLKDWCAIVSIFATCSDCFAKGYSCHEGCHKEAWMEVLWLPSQKLI